MSDSSSQKRSNGSLAGISSPLPLAHCSPYPIDACTVTELCEDLMKIG
jgi:hypothetical protein